MLALLFTSLQSSINTLLAKPFLQASLLPLLIFVAACAAMADSAGGALQASVRSLNPMSPSTNGTAWQWLVAFAALIAGANVMSSLNGLLLQLMEGKHLGWLSRLLYAGELKRIQEIERRLQDCNVELTLLLTPASVGGKQRFVSLLEGLKNPSLAPPATGTTKDVRRVLRKRRLGLPIQVKELEAAVAGLTPADSALRGPLADAIEFTSENLLYEIQRLTHQRRFEYPFVANAARGKSALNLSGPTRMANITRTMRAYALDRYNLDLNIFWLRLQNVIPSTAYAALQDSKTQVDFLVSLFWVTLLFLVTWCTVFLFVAPSAGRFLALGALGPIVMRWIYLAACQNYIVFADLTRSAVDLYRPLLLDQLRLPRPPGSCEERELWNRLGEWLAYAKERDINYKG